VTNIYFKKKNGFELIVKNKKKIFESTVTNIISKKNNRFESTVTNIIFYKKTRFKSS
jgi:hypothetical protein